MAGFTDADYATIIAAFIIALIPAYFGPRVSRIGFLQRREVLGSLARLNPAFATLRKFPDEMSAAGVASFIAGFLAAIFGPLAVAGIASPAFIPFPPAIFFLVVSLGTYEGGLTLSRTRAESGEGPNKKPARRVLKPNAPAIWLRVFILQVAAFAGIGFSFPAHPSEFLDSSNLVLVVEGLAFGVWYAFQDLDYMVTTEDLLFKDKLTASKKDISVEAYVLLPGEQTSEVVKGRLESIGPKLCVTRDDGYTQELNWTWVSRVATKPEQGAVAE